MNPGNSLKRRKLRHTTDDDEDDLDTKQIRSSSTSSLSSMNGFSVSGDEGEDETGQDEEDDNDEKAESGYALEMEADSQALSRVSRLKPVKSPADSRHKSQAPASFASLGVSSLLQNMLAKMSIRVPTEIQVACIAPLLEGRDCIGNAKTGSGKTIAFALPILQKLSMDPYGIYALVLTPTRELAFQISEQFAALGAVLNLRTAVVVGGMDMIAQALELSNHPHIVVATPGRIVDLLKTNCEEWNFSRIKFLVLDEADRLLTPTFAPELSYLFKILPSERQTCLFTATWSPSVEKLADAPPRLGKLKPFVHRISASVETVETLKQYYILVPSHVRESYLFDLLCNPPDNIVHMRRAPPEPTPPLHKVKRKKSQGGAKSSQDDPQAPQQPPPTIIFCNRPRTAAYLTSLLRTLSIRSTALHSRLTQRERLNSLSLFRSYVVPVLVSTDVGARGLDITDVAMVINWDMPVETEEYTHRVGRTARAGRGGLAVSFATERDEERVLKIEERINTKLAEMILPEKRVLEKLNAVSAAKRMANIELYDTKFGRREEIHKLKKASKAS